MLETICLLQRHFKKQGNKRLVKKCKKLLMEVL
jgi:hypothetical protein